MSHLNTHIKSHKQGDFLKKGGRYFDPFGQSVHRVLQFPAKWHKVEVSSDRTPDITSTSTASRRVTFDLPTDMELVRLAIKSDLGVSTTSDYMDHLGIGLFSKIEFLDGGKVITDMIDPRDAMIWGLSRMTNSNAVAQLLSCYGGVGTTTTSTGPNIISWIPMFFDPWCAPGVEPLQTHKLKKPKLRVTYTINTSLLDASGTGGSVTSSSLLCYGYMIPEKPLNHKPVEESKSFDLDYVVVREAFANTTEVTSDIKGINGKIKELLIHNTVATDLSAGVGFYQFQTIDYIKDKLNNHEDDVFLNKQEGLFDMLILNNGIGNYQTTGEMYKVNYNYVMHDYSSNDYGGVHSNDITSHDLKIYHSTGSAGVYSITACVSAKYVYLKNGGIVKKI